MKAAVVRQAGQLPVYAEMPDPLPLPGENRVTVCAAAISQVAKGRVSGQHYSASRHFPFVAGIDGVGRLDDGRRVYFALPREPFGSMAERSVVAADHCVALPDDIDDVTAAAIANPGQSSWAALVERARIAPGETVLVNGATGTSGRLAVQIAKHLGAGKVIATGRDRRALDELAGLGADATVALVEDGDRLERSLLAPFADGVDIVLDYLWGRSAERLLIAAAKAGADRVPIRYVQIGSIGGSDITLPGAVLRATAIQLMGSGIGSIPLDRFLQATQALLKAAVPSGFRIATNPLPLSEVARAWPLDDGKRRTVFTLPG